MTRSTSPLPSALLTEWGERLDREHPLAEYPRPQLVRDSYLNLNGVWQYAITPDGATVAGYDGEIVVPFSPESVLSGVGRQLQPDETLHYRRTFTLDDAFVPERGRVLLHFGAVDQRCTVEVNGRVVGDHVGGYLPFTIDITDALAARPADAAHELKVRVTDPSDTSALSRGKQTLRRGGIWYTAQSGIWQTVWIEAVPAAWVGRIGYRADPASGELEITVHTESAQPEAEADALATVRVSAGGLGVAEGRAAPGHPLALTIASPRPWSPEDPFLYDVVVEYADDRVESYAGLRSFGVGPDSDGVPRLLLNGEPYFHAGVLDQGYWSDGLYTAPSDEAMVHDIRTMKELGFTMLRKHIKIEPLRWYHHADRLGMLVWQDAVNGGDRYHPLVITAPVLTPLRLDDRRYRAFGRADASARAHWRDELREMVEHLHGVVSIAVWVPFNEGWGQFDAVDVTAELRALDPSRSIDHASGWHDQGAGDLTSLHVYFRRFRVPRRRTATAHRALVLSEYGGYSRRLPEHSVTAREFGYKRYRTSDELGAAFVRLHEEEIIPALAKGLGASVYTQLSDVEDESNGLLSYDRRVVKVAAELVRSVNGRLRFAEAGRAGIERESDG
ncbi:glycoside hydrolase family 2 [Agromyces badenianii]|uniref:Glycoside hydrolase family 2 n=1 Tax=Agromyces badenianii TaxID=2080742 RepID=A0A2S0WVW4_9MICO|nr:sugar-binding domain-containing protein [Agromyces badenianii]AWB95441.1 glycoside hydrolase family 2 [Agromyces badenianii]